MAYSSLLPPGAFSGGGGVWTTMEHMVTNTSSLHPSSDRLGPCGSKVTDQQDCSLCKCQPFPNLQSRIRHLSSDPCGHEARRLSRHCNITCPRADPTKSVPCSSSTSLCRSVSNGYRSQRLKEEREYIRLNRARRADLGRVVTATSLAELDLDDGDQMKQVYKTLGAAVYSLRVAMDRLTRASEGSPRAYELERKTLFEELISQVTMSGGDANTNAAIAGVLLGAYLGYDAIPPDCGTGSSSWPSPGRFVRRRM